MWPHGLQWTEDKGRAGTLAWGTCNDIPLAWEEFSPRGLRFWGPANSNSWQHEVAEGRGGWRGQGARPQPTSQEGTSRSHSVVFPNPERSTQSHCGAAGPRDFTVFVEIKMLLIKVAVVERRERSLSTCSKLAPVSELPGRQGSRGRPCLAMIKQEHSYATVRETRDFAHAVPAA